MSSAVTSDTLKKLQWLLGRGGITLSYGPDKHCRCGSCESYHIVAEVDDKKYEFQNDSLTKLIEKVFNELPMDCPACESELYGLPHLCGYDPQEGIGIRV